MNKKDFINLKFFSTIYLNLEEKKVNFLDIKIKSLKEDIEKEKKLLEANNENFKKLSEENTKIKKEYDKFLKLFKDEHKIISIRNNNYNISIWENLIIVKKASYYVIQTKKEEGVIYTFDKNMVDFFDYFVTLDYSIIVLSVSKNKISLQLRLN